MRNRFGSTILAIGAVVLMMTLWIPNAGAAAPSVGTNRAVRKIAISQTASGVVPLSAQGCNQNTCIYVDGSGLHVNFIEVYTRDGADLPPGSFAEIVVNGSDAFPGGLFTIGDNSEGIIVYYSRYYDFPNNAWVCGNLDATTGYPCETVHR